MDYEQILARQPASTVVGDRAAATAFVEFLSAQMEQGINTLTDSQRRYLYKLRAKWQERADGKDERWSTHGSRPGRPTNSGRSSRRGGNYRREEENDPLLASLLRKFGTPIKEDI